METLETLRAQIENARQLHSVVKTMKSLAAVNIKQYEEAVRSLADYSRTINLGLQIALRNQSVEIDVRETETGTKLGVVVFGSEQGLVGQFNERIGAFALDRMQDLAAREDRLVLVVGSRIAIHLAASRQPLDDQFPMPSSLTGVTAAVQNMLLKIQDWRVKRDVKRVVLFFNSPETGASYEPKMRWLLPIDPEWLESLQRQSWYSRVLPTFTMDWEQLFASLIRHYFFVLLYRAFAESMASENSSRLSSMEAAEKNISERLDSLQMRYQRVRQRSITEELLDIASGFEALTADRR